MPADRHQGMFQGTRNTAEAKPSFGVPIVDAPVSGVSAKSFGNLGAKFVARIEALQAVDEGVRKIVRTLGRTGELDNTYIIFTSDNGYLLGEHGLTAKEPHLRRGDAGAVAGPFAPTRIRRTDV